MMKQHDPSYMMVFGHSIHKAWLMLLGCCFIQAGGVGTVLLSAGVFYVPICDELGFARSEMSLWMTAYFLATIPATPIAGKLFIRYNIRVPMVVSIIAIALSVGLMSTYTQIWQWVFSGAIIGAFGACVLMMPSAILIGNWFTKSAGLAMGISACSSALAGALLAPFYQWVIESIGWRFTYLMEAVIILVLCLPWALFVFKLRPRDVGALPYGLQENFKKENESAKKSVTTEPMREAIPYKTALRSISFKMLIVFASLSAFLGSGFDTHLPGVAISFGLDAAFGALLLSALQLGSFFDKLLMGILNDRVGVQKTIYIEFVMVILGILGLIVFKEPVLLIISAFLFGVQDSLISVSVPLLVRQIFGVNNYVQLYSWLRVGVGIFGAFASVLVGLSYDLTGDFLPALLAALIFAFIGALSVFIAYWNRKNLIADTQK